MYFCHKKKYNLCKNQLQRLSVNDGKKTTSENVEASSRRDKIADCAYCHQSYKENGYLEEKEKVKINDYDHFCQTVDSFKKSYTEAILGISCEGRIGHCILLDNGKLLDPPEEEEFHYEQYKSKKIKSVRLFIPHVEKLQDIKHFCKNEATSSLPDAPEDLK